MSKHSEGPWIRNANLIFTENLPSRVVCELSEPEPGKWLEHKKIDLGSPNWDEAMENGNLIKAAPQMAAALVSAMGNFCDGCAAEAKSCTGCDPWSKSAIAALDAAGVKHE